MIRIIFLLFPLTLFAETTGNLITQDFTDGTWSGTNISSLHGSTTIAGVNDKYIESTINLNNTLTQEQINNGWTSTLGGDIWHWNADTSITQMKQTITGSNGTITTQIRNISSSSCGFNNCGQFATYKDSYTQGLNEQSNYSINVKFTFNESTSNTNHHATDLKNPTLNIEHSLLDTSQVIELKTMSEVVYNVVEDIDFYEYIPEQEFTFEITEQPTIEISTIEEFYFEPQAIEELNSGVVDVFQEITYEEIPTEIKVEEVFVERTESFNEKTTNEFTEEIFETSNLIGEPEGESIKDTISEPSPSIQSEPKESEESIAKETESTIEKDNVPENPSRSKESTTEDTVVTEEIDDPVREREAGGSEPTDERTEVATSGEETLESRSTSVEDSRTEGTVRVRNQNITVESIEKKVNQTLKRIDQRLIATSMIVAKAMQSPLSLDNYSKTNNNIFINQLVIDGGNYYDKREYIDGRNIYAQSQVMYKDIISEYNQVVQESVDNTIRAEEHLRSIRGY